MSAEVARVGAGKVRGWGMGLSRALMSHTGVDDRGLTCYSGIQKVAVGAQQRFLRSDKQRCGQKGKRTTV